MKTSLNVQIVVVAVALLFLIFELFLYFVGFSDLNYFDEFEAGVISIGLLLFHVLLFLAVSFLSIWLFKKGKIWLSLTVSLLPSIVISVFPVALITGVFASSGLLSLLSLDGWSHSTEVVALKLFTILLFTVLIFAIIIYLIRLAVKRISTEQAWLMIKVLIVWNFILVLAWGWVELLAIFCLYIFLLFLLPAP